MKTKNLCFIILMCFFLAGGLDAQDVVKRERPEEWDGLVFGGRFMDRFLSLPEIGEPTSETWGAAGVIPRHVENGLEDNIWSYWGGNIHLDADGKYHMFPCRWREDEPKGHMAWPQSEVVHAFSDHAFGPYKVVDVIGPGHNPEMQQLADGRYFLYVSKFSDYFYYLAEDLNGPWERHEFIYDNRERPILDHISNCSFARREDGSMLMVVRGGEIWASKNGLPPYRQLSQETVYPPYEGRYEDPVIWKTNIQYHLIVNDWIGRIAYYMRSKDGINWKLDAGEAYLPGIARHKDGHVEDWYKFERIKVLQDEYGRAYLANFAVADTIKRQDKQSDNHSSKNLCIPLTVGRLIEIMDDQKIDENTEEITLLVRSEPGFDPHKDMNIKSLRFGASEEVDFGRGSKVVNTEKQGNDLVLTFSGRGNDLTKDNFAAKLLGETKSGELLFGFARLPWLNYNMPALSAMYPEFISTKRSIKASLEIQNFGQVSSEITNVRIEHWSEGEWKSFADGNVPVLKPFEKANLTFWGQKMLERNGVVKVRVTIEQPGDKPSVLEGPVVVR